MHTLLQRYFVADATQKRRSMSQSTCTYTIMSVTHAGINPTVKLSGEFNSIHNHMSKRGSPYLMYAIFMSAVPALSMTVRRMHITKRNVTKESMYAERTHEKCSDVPLDLHAHHFRHARASHWLEEGMNIVEISVLLGHEQLYGTIQSGSSLWSLLQCSLLHFNRLITNQLFFPPASL